MAGEWIDIGDIASKDIAAPMPTGTQPVTIRNEITLDDIAGTPLQTASPNVQRIGAGPDKRAVVNVQGISTPLRIATQLLFDTADEKRAFLQSKLGPNYMFSTHPDRPNDLIIRNKADNQWGVVDPGGLSIGELIAEAGDNIDTIAQIFNMPAGPVAGALTAGGIQAIRQGLKQLLIGGEADPGASVGAIARDALAGGVSGAVAGVPGAAVMGSSRLVSGVKGKTAGVPATTGSILGRVGQSINILKQPRFIAQELGATASHFEEFGRRPITENIQWLLDNVPEFTDALNGSFTRKGKFESLSKLFNETGDTIKDIYTQTNGTVKVSDIFDTEAFRQLSTATGQTGEVIQGGKRVLVNKGTKARIANARRDFLDQIGELVLGDPANKEVNQFLKMYRKGEGKGNLLSIKALRDKGATTNDEAMMLLLRDQDIPLLDAWGVRMFRDDLLNYNKQRGAITALNTAQKMTADAMRDGIAASLRRDFPDIADELLAKNELFSQLYPVLKMADKGAAGASAERLNFVKYWPGSINSGIRRAAMLGTKAANSEAIRTMIRTTKGSVLPLPAGKTIKGGAALGNVIPQVLRGTGFLSAQELIDRQVMPRNAEAYFEDPEMVNQIAGQVGDPELTDAMVRSLEKGDKETFSNMLSMVASQSPDLFEQAPYNSLVINNGVPTLMDKYDREQYRQYLEKNVLDPAERYKALQLLNMKSVMSKPPFEPLKIKGGQPENGSSNISKAAAGLSSTTVDVGDGTSRVDHDY